LLLPHVPVDVAHVLTEEARSALPNAPVRPEPVRSQTPTRLDLVRLRLGLVLRRMADWVEPALRPAPEC
jgi:hypothetical protein